MPPTPEKFHEKNPTVCFRFKFVHFCCQFELHTLTLKDMIESNENIMFVPKYIHKITKTLPHTFFPFLIFLIIWQTKSRI